MYISTSKSKNATLYYVCKSYRKDGGGTSSKRIEKLGSIDDVKKRCGCEDPHQWMKTYALELTERERLETLEVTVSYKPGAPIEYGKRSLFNGGYLFLDKMYHRLGLDRICRDIKERRRFEFDLDRILSRLIYTRVLYPGSKLSAFEDSKRLIEQPSFELEDIYRSLSVLAEESDFVQSRVFHNSQKVRTRDTSVIYYDCTNFFFEIEQADEYYIDKKGELKCGPRQYGRSKEHRPNPIVQMGMFMDSEGLPLAFCIDPGNTAETKTMVPLQKKLNADFSMSDYIVCTDAGLSAVNNRRFNDKEGRHYITVQSLKGTKIEEHLREWALSPEGWHVSGMDRDLVVTLFSDDAAKYSDRVFYKERWTKEKGIEQRLIVTWTKKYADYTRALRQQQVDRAMRAVENGTAKRRKKSPTDSSRFISETHCTGEGEVAQKTVFSIDQKAIEEEARFDGFYAICTNCEELSTLDVLRANSSRWEIEDMFRVLKTDFRSRPVYVRREDRIKAHFITCFLALLVFKMAKMELGMADLTTSQLREALIGMDYDYIEARGYKPVFERNDITEAICCSIDPCLRNQIVMKRKMNSVIKVCVKDS